MIPPLSFTEAESCAAARIWCANCGPHSLAAACGVSLLCAVESLPDFIKKRYTNPTMMEAGLKALDRRYIRTKGLHIKTLPTHGVARIQWEGRWCRSDAPAIAAYAHTHWVASDGEYVFCTAAPKFGWIPRDEWDAETDALCLRANYDGWHVTHHYLLL